MFVGVTHHLAEEVATPSQQEEVDGVATNAEEVAIPFFQREHCTLWYRIVQYRIV